MLGDQCLFFLEAVSRFPLQSFLPENLFINRNLSTSKKGFPLQSGLGVFSINWNFVNPIEKDEMQDETTSIKRN